MRFLVTGAGGCIGAWTVKLLLERSVEVVCYDVAADTERLSLISDATSWPLLRLEQGRIEDTARVKDLVRQEGITHIIHLAAVLMPFCQANPVAGAMVNVIGTLNIFEAARDAGRAVRVVYASSSAVWGPEDAYNLDRPLTETDPTLPRTHYGVFKQTNENNARVFYHTNGISSIGIRPWTVYGVGRDGGLTADATLAIKAAVLGQPYRIRLSGFMDLQYVEDVAETFIRSALAGLEGAFVFNLAGTIIRMNDYIALLDRLRPGAAALISAQGPQVPVSYRMDDSALHSKIAGIPKTPLEEGVRKTFERFEALQRAQRLNPDLG